MNTTPTHRGFTLIEVIVALFIISVSVVFTTIAVTMVKGTRNTTFENIALHIAQTKLSELRAGGYAALPVSGAFSNSELSNIPQGVASTTVTDLNAKTKQVIVGVSWLGTNTETHYVSLYTLITETGGL